APERAAAPEARGSLLPRRPAPGVPEAAETQPAPAATAPPAAPSGTAVATTASFLPRKGRVAGRAERLRQQMAHLEPLDETSAVPVDRTPYLWLDLRRVIGVSLIMVVAVIVGAIVLH
ncbi:MAG: hypothetical protein ACREN1_09500, partial [Candidatus Dormibacteria bacterium]